MSLALKARIARYLETCGHTREAANTEAAKYSGHSRRVGMYTAAFEAGIAIPEPAADMPALLDRSEQRLASSRAGRAQSRALFALAANISLRTLHRLETSG